MTSLRNLRPTDYGIMTVEDTGDERTTHKASCQCGAIQFEVTLKYAFPKYPINTCSCSICTRNGYLLVYPLRRDVVFTRGLENLGTYMWNTKKRSHKFCKTCGSSLAIDLRMGEPGQPGENDPRRDVIAVNVRSFKDLDLDALEYTFFDGKNKVPQVETAESSEP